MMKIFYTSKLPTQMIMGWCQKLGRCFGFLLCAGALTVMSMTLGASRVYATGEQSRTYSLEIRGEHLGDVVQKLAKMSGYEISLDPNWEMMPVSVSMRNVSLYEGLNLLLSRLNKAIVIDTGKKKCSIIMFDSFADHQNSSFGDSDGKSNSAGANEHLRSSLNSEDTIDSLDMVVLPPLVPGEKGITLRELAELKKNQNQLNDENREIIPPGKSGEKGITARDLEKLVKLQNQINLKNREVLPPSDPGEKGITLQELNEIKYHHQQIKTVNLVELPPKIPQKKQ